MRFYLTPATRCLEWYDKVQKWKFAQYAVPGGEWRQRLMREGHPTYVVIGLPVKDPFHLPRAAILITQLLAEPRGMDVVRLFVSASCNLRLVSLRRRR